MCAIHYSCQEQPKRNSENYAAPQVQRVSQKVLQADYSPCPNLEGQFETRWCLELFNKLEDLLFIYTWLWWLWILDADLWIGQAAQTTHQTTGTVPMRQIPVKGSTNSVFALARESWILQNRNVKNWMGRNPVFKLWEGNCKRTDLFLKTLNPPKLLINLLKKCS